MWFFCFSTSEMFLFWTLLFIVRLIFLLFILLVWKGDQNLLNENHIFIQHLLSLVEIKSTISILKCIILIYRKTLQDVINRII